MTTSSTADGWPSLRVEDWAPTRDTLHMWSQIVGKIRLTYAPLVNHWWQVTSYVTPRGLSTSAIPHGTGVFDIEFDFVDHRLVIRTSTGAARTVALAPKSVAQFYSETMGALDDLGLPTRIQPHPNTMEAPWQATEWLIAQNGILHGPGTPSCLNLPVVPVE